MDQEIYDMVIDRTAIRMRDWKDGVQRLVDAIGDAKYVLLGEATHGTSEFYSFRAELSKRLIEEKGFRFVAVEGDWPSCYTVNRYVKAYSADATNPADALRDFGRWPEWMWANREVAEFIAWLRAYNDRTTGPKAGFYGLDVYSLWESLEEILNYLRDKGGADLEAARHAFECFEPYGRDEQSYGLSASLFDSGCEDEVVALLRKLQDRWKEAANGDRESALSGELNAMAVVGAEKYYRTMIKGDEESWNVRDRHMVAALDKLIDFHGGDAKVIVWEHNTHIGDARATDMAEDGMVNVGQLLREEHRGDVFAVGFGTYEGTAIAGSSWGAPPEAMEVPPARPGSWEERMHRIFGGDDAIVVFDEEADALFGQATIGHRAIGVVYNPARDRGHYVPTAMARRYDAFVHIDRTKAVTPLADVQVFA